MHLNDGQLRASLDNQADEHLQSHLRDCEYCQTRLSELTSRSERVNHSLDLLNYSALEPTITSERARFDLYVERKESHRMYQKIFSRRTRPVWIGFGLVAVLALSLAFPPLRAIANNFLGLFRVEQVAVVQVNPLDLPQGLDESANLEALFAEDMQITTQGEMKVVESVAEAGSLAGIPVRLPTDVQGKLTLEVQPPTQMTFRVHLSRIQTILDEFGLTEINLPTDIDGAVVTADISGAVYATYGDCSIPQGDKPGGFDPDDPATYPQLNCTQLIQMASPEVTAPPEVDLQQIGQIYLQLLGMDNEEATRFSQNIDWSTTLVLPLPMDGYEYSQVPIHGVTGTLISSTGENNHSFTLLWVADGITFMLIGNGGTATALAIANSIH